MGEALLYGATADLDALEDFICQAARALVDFERDSELDTLQRYWCFSHSPLIPTYKNAQ